MNSIDFIDRAIIKFTRFINDKTYFYEENLRMGKAVVLLSGGLDSTTVLAIASQKHECHTLSFNYNQRHRIELEYAKRQSKLFNARSHQVIGINMDYIIRHDHDASLVNFDSDVPENRDESKMTDIPSTYVPARNTIFLAHAAALAEVVGADKIYIGVNALDYSGYPDCRPEYILAYQNMLDYATKQGIEGNAPDIVAPLIDLTKSQIIEQGMNLGVDYSLTNSCYNPSIKIDDEGYDIAIPCGVCDSCILRAKGFQEYNNKIKVD